ncbi:MAG: response regulator transcription factor [Rhodoferax sp.]|nr:response regulator transcription factor [Rhodoferax sp.]
MTEPILLVEDDETFSAIVAGYLESEGWAVEVVTTGHEMLRRVSNRIYGVVLLDLGLPDEDGLALLRKLVGRCNVPVMVVTGRNSDDTRIAAFELGAADILTKPLNPRELRYRVLNLLQRRAVSTLPEHLDFGSWRIDIPFRTVEFGPMGPRCHLTKAEFDTLVFLLRGNGRVYSRAQILDAVTASNGPESDRAVDILISRLRRKLRLDATSDVTITTVRGLGYRVDHARAK